MEKEKRDFIPQKRIGTAQNAEAGLSLNRRQGLAPDTKVRYKTPTKSGLAAGFTLVELLIVIAVISILIGIAIPRFKGMQQEGWYAQANSELKTVQTAIESYYLHQKSYPATTATICASVLNSASPAIITDVLYDPFRGNGSTNEYYYRASDNGQYYLIYSYGLDGAQDITGISDAGVLAGADDDDIYVTNGTGF